jgi:hypothetical protein
MQAMLGLPSGIRASAGSEAWVHDVSENRKTIQHARRAENHDGGPRSTSKAQIVRQLRLYQRDPWYHGEYRVPFAALARHIGVSRDTLHEAANGIMSAKTAEALTPVIAAIEQGRMTFRRCGAEWGVWINDPPDRLPPPQPPLVEVEAFNEWSRCRACGSKRYLAVEIAGRAHMACNRCLPRSQWRSIGARPGRTARRRPNREAERFRGSL